MESNPANGIKDTMWDFLKDGKQKANIPALKEYVYDLIKLTTQKDAGQRGNKSNLSFANVEMTMFSIVCEATALVLSGKLDELEGSDGNEA